jgi:hypothetical protein
MSYLMLTNTVPFKNLGDLYEYAYRASSFPSDLLEEYTVSEEGRGFIIKLMSSESQDRLRAPAAKSHRWLLRIDPNEDVRQGRVLDDPQNLYILSNTDSGQNFSNFVME